MQIQFWSVGKKHDSFILEGVEDFSGRIKKYFPVEWKIILPPKNASALQTDELKKAESELILSQLQKDDYLILLDERGKQLSSIELSDFLQQKIMENRKRLIFLIGGAFGVHLSITQRSNFVWSFSKLVFPHMLVRLILAEQVYRACTILRNEKYHHQ